MNRKYDHISAVALLLAGISVSPSLLMKIGGIQEGLFFMMVMPVFALWLLFKRKVCFSTPVVIVLYLQVITLLFLALYHGSDLIVLTFNIVTLMGIIVAYLALENDLIVLEIFIKFYIQFIALLLILAVISVLLAFWGMLEPHQIYNRGLMGDQLGDTVYRVGLTLSNDLIQFGGGNYLVRAGGIFDEPGQFGIMVMLAVLANKVILGNKRYELLLIVLGFFTSSLGYYVFVWFYLFFWRRKIWFLVSSLFIVGILGGFIVEGMDADTLVFSQTISRVLYLFGSGFGGNRSEGTAAALSMLWDVGLFGLDADKLVKYSQFEVTAATIFSPFLFNGLLGGLILYLHILLLGASAIIQVRGHVIRLVKNNSFRVFVLMSLSLYHRPSTMYFLYYLILLSIYLYEKRNMTTHLPGYKNQLGNNESASTSYAV